MRKCDCGATAYKRGSVGPTGTGRSHDFMVLCDTCPTCGRQYAVFPERLTYFQQRWVDRWNARITKQEIEE